MPTMIFNKIAAALIELEGKTIEKVDAVESEYGNGQMVEATFTTTCGHKVKLQSQSPDCESFIAIFKL